jgi:hypothetical protein
MTDINSTSGLMYIIKQNNISLDFLKSSIDNEYYHNAEFNYNNLFYNFYSLDVCAFQNFFNLLQTTEDKLIGFTFTKTTIDKLKIFLSQYNCHIGMFANFSTASFYDLTNDKVKIEELTNDEKSLSLAMLKCLVDTHPNDTVLGGEIRKIFKQLKS